MPDVIIHYSADSQRQVKRDIIELSLTSFVFMKKCLNYEALDCLDL